MIEMDIIAIILLLLFLAVTAWFKLPWAIYLVIAGLPSYAWRFNINGIPTTALELMIYVTFIVWVIKVIIQQVKINQLAIRTYLWPTILVLLGVILGTIVSSDMRISLGILKGWFIDPILLFLVVTSVLTTKNSLRGAIVALISSGILLSIWAIYQVVAGQFITIDQRASAFFSSANYLALYLTPIIILSIGLLDIQSKIKKYLILISMALMSVALYFTFSYGGWLGLIVALATIAFIKLPKWPTIIGAIILFGAAILSQLNHPKFQQMLDLFGRSSSHSRLQIWQTSWLMIKTHSLFGIGLGLFEKRYADFVYQLFNSPLETKVLHAHNIFLIFWINSGLLGLLGFLGLIITFFKKMFKLLRQSDQLLVVAVMSAMIALITHGLVDTAYWKNDLSALFWLILAFGIILSQIISKENNVSHRN